MEKEGTHEKGGEGVWGGLRRFGTLLKKNKDTVVFLQLESSGYLLTFSLG